MRSYGSLICGFLFYSVTFSIGCGRSERETTTPEDSKETTTGGNNSSDSTTSARAGAGNGGDTNASVETAATGGSAGASVLAIKETLLIDDVEDGDAVTKLSGQWITYDDRLDNGVSTVSPAAWQDDAAFPMSQPGYGDSGYAVRVSGTTGSVLTWDYFGLLVSLGAHSFCPDPQPEESTLAIFRGIRFKAKASRNGGTFTMIVAHRKEGTIDNCSRGLIGDSLTEWGDYQFDFTSQVTGEWSTITIDFRKELYPPAWGTPADLEVVLEHAKDIVWQYQNGLGGAAELWLDDVELFR
jgi:hypothetical protein